MSEILQLAEAARLHHAENRWLLQSRDRIRRAAADHAARATADRRSTDPVAPESQEPTP